MTAKLITEAGTVELTGAAAKLAELLAVHQCDIAALRFGYVRFNFGNGELSSVEVNRNLKWK